ncbi:hypothetical protein H0H87_012019 [Tephrocybe sp. NHM501043]|nr:hypothetical protein H0H87_012019 [Tephrocybe sp. NHM501043]
MTPPATPSIPPRPTETPEAPFPPGGLKSVEALEVGSALAVTVVWLTRDIDVVVGVIGVVVGVIGVDDVDATKVVLVLKTPRDVELDVAEAVPPLTETVSEGTEVPSHELPNSVRSKKKEKD